MRPKNKQLSEKYKALRLPLDAFYDSRVVQTFFNKFIRRGKRATARSCLYRALQGYRLAAHQYDLRLALLDIFRRMRVQLVLLPKRQARQYIDVPVPVRRNKRDVINLQTIYRAISDRRETNLHTRIRLELLALTLLPWQSTTLRARSSQLARVYQERASMDYRWK